MRKNILATFCMFFLASCSSQSKTHIDIPTIPSVQNPDLPFYVDFSEEKWTNFIYSKKAFSFENWYIEEIKTNTFDYANTPIDEKTIVLQKDYVEQVPSGANGPSLYFGSPKLKDYNFSFDFLDQNDDGLVFSIYTESLGTDWQGDGKQPFWFTLGSNGHGLSFDTAFGKGSFFYKSEDGKVLLSDYDTTVWNTVELKMYDNNLHFIFNGEDYGTIYAFDGTQCGGAAIGCGGGTIFKNIQLTPLM